MKIMHVIHGFGSGGAEVFVRDLSVRQQEQGHRVAIAHFSGRAHSGVDEFAVSYRNVLQESGVVSISMAPRSRTNPPLGIIEMWRAVANFKPDVLHLHAGRNVLFRGLVPSRTTTVFTYHRSVESFNPMFFRAIDRIVDCYIAVGKSSRRYLDTVVHGKVSTIRNGIPAGRIPFVEYRSHRPTLRVLSVGNLREEKNYPIVVEVARLLRERDEGKFSAVRFEIAGEGPQRSTLQSLIERHSLKPCVSLLGQRSDVASLMANSDVLLMPSLFEGLPISLIEAAFSGLPVIATDVGGIPEVVQHRVNGLLVRPNSASDIVDALLELISNPELLPNYSRAARAGSGEFGLSKCCDLHLKLYQELLAD